MRFFLALVVGCSSSQSPPQTGDVVVDEPTTAVTEPSTKTTMCEELPALRGEELSFSEFVVGHREECEPVVHEAAGPGGAEFELTLEEWAGPATVSFLRPNGQTWFTAALSKGESTTVVLPFPGRFDVLISAEEGSVDEGGGYGLSWSCVSGCEQSFTRDPIVLMHGMAGTDSFFSVVDYFNGVKPVLDSHGYMSFAPAVDPLQISDVRGEQWITLLEGYKEQYGVEKFNLIGHSQGGLDARWLAFYRPDLVASVTTVSTPHRGTPSADLAAIVDGWALVDGIGDMMGLLYGLDTDQDLGGQLYQLSTDGAAEFNTVILDNEEIDYYSWGGASCQLLDLICVANRGGEIVDPLLSASHLYVLAVDGDNDGLVSLKSAKWGTYLGTVNADHLDQVGLLFAGGYDHIGFFEDEAHRLMVSGY